MAIVALKNITTLEEFQNTLNAPGKVLIGTSGGRSFQLNSQLTVKFKDLTNHCNHLAQKALQACQTVADKEEVQNQIRLLTNILTSMDVAGDVELRKASACVRFLTAIRQFFGNLGRSSHITLLSQLFKSAVLDINQTTPAAVAFGEALNKCEAKHSKPLSWILANIKAKIANTPLSAPKDLDEQVMKTAMGELEELLKEFLALPLNDKIEILEKQKSKSIMSVLVVFLIKKIKDSDPDQPIPIILQYSLIKEILASTSA